MLFSSQLFSAPKKIQMSLVTDHRSTRLLAKAKPDLAEGHEFKLQ